MNKDAGSKWGIVSSTQVGDFQVDHTGRNNGKMMHLISKQQNHQVHFSQEV